MDRSPPGSSVHGILQARRLEWVTMPSSREYSWPRDQTQVFCIAGGFFTIWVSREALKNMIANFKQQDLRLAPSWCLLSISNWDEILSHCFHTLFWASYFSTLSFHCEFRSSSGLFFLKENKKSLLASCHQDGVPALPGAWQDGLCLLWASCWEAAHDYRWYWSEQGFDGWTLHSSEETGYAFLMHVAPWPQPSVPTQCLPEVSLKSLREGSVKALVVQSCPTLGDPVDCSPPESSVQGILQERTLEWVAISFSRGPSRPRDRTNISHISCIGRRVLYH